MAGNSDFLKDCKTFKKETLRTFNIKASLQKRTLKEYLILLFYLVSVGYQFFWLWSLKFEIGHQIFGVELKSHFEAWWSNDANVSGLSILDCSWFLMILLWAPQGFVTCICWGENRCKIEQSILEWNAFLN
jgi:hypothetical protein